MAAWFGRFRLRDGLYFMMARRCWRVMRQQAYGVGRRATALDGLDAATDENLRIRTIDIAVSPDTSPSPSADRVGGFDADRPMPS